MLCAPIEIGNESGDERCNPISRKNGDEPGKCRCSGSVVASRRPDADYLRTETGQNCGQWNNVFGFWRPEFHAIGSECRIQMSDNQIQKICTFNPRPSA